jgi:hypothetical protein
MGRACSEHGENAYKILVGKPERTIPLGTSRRSWEDNIKIDLGEIGRGGLDSSGSYEHGNAPSGSINGGEFPD